VRREGDALSMVAGRSADHAPGPLFLGQQAELVPGAARLERAGALKAFQFQVDTLPRLRAGMTPELQGRTDDLGIEVVAGGDNRVMFYQASPFPSEMFHHYREPNLEVMSRQIVLPQRATFLRTFKKPGITSNRECPEML
jgi:hypothetical protein